ncbi:DUF4256 domain-containing protein [Gracilibacillus marinus]|uniref:DUF4256 domain-containing protein n=1 Tax=Gracilibacillus marinus TaxID=630535 RepID=A0ABV8VV94_9BACI
MTFENTEKLIRTLRERYEKEVFHKAEWDFGLIEERLRSDKNKLESLREMERTGGEPAIVDYDEKEDKFILFDCCKESPVGRRSVCYDQEALQSRKKHKPETSAIDMAKKMGIEILTEEQYVYLQQLGEFDLKTSSWVKTPSSIREKGGALFCDRRYGQVFLYHNGADSYYKARGFRGSLKI